MLRKNIVCKVLSLLIAVALIAVVPMTAAATEDEVTYVIAGSDFQHPNGGRQNADIVKNILSAMENDGITNPYGFLFAGDYGYSESDATHLQNLIKETLPELQQKVYIQGNHDNLLLTVTNEDEPLCETGNQDPENGKGPYGVFVINEQDYPTEYEVNAFFEGMPKSLEDVQRTTENTAMLLEEYLNEKCKAGFDKPIFIVSHLPLHVTQRTYQGMNGAPTGNYAKPESPETCGLYAKAIVDVLNAAGEKGLNIIFLYGHDHGWGFDSVVGGDSVYLTKGETLRYANGGTPEAPNVESAALQFTYMNAGYTGYYQYDTLEKSEAANDGAITMTVFAITEDSVGVLRYDENGKCPLARVPYHTTVPADDEALGYTGLLPLEEAGGTLDNVTTVQAKIGAEGTTLMLNRELKAAFSWYYIAAGAALAVVIGAVILIMRKRKATGK